MEGVEVSEAELVVTVALGEEEDSVEATVEATTVVLGDPVEVTEEVGALLLILLSLVLLPRLQPRRQSVSGVASPATIKSFAEPASQEVLRVKMPWNFFVCTALVLELEYIYYLNLDSHPLVFPLFGGG